MKKYLRYADVLVLFAGALGLLLRLIMVMGGTDEKGLYPRHHAAWILLCILSVAVVAVLFLLTRQVGADQRYKKNFPASIPGAVCTALAAVGITFTAFDLFKADLLHILCFLAGLAAMAGLLLAAYCRLNGRKPHFVCHAAPAIFFALRVFLLGKDLGSEPEASRYIFEMLASLAMIPACYQLWGFDVGLGRRDKCLFWSLTAAYLCIVAIVGIENWLLYLTSAAWLLTNMCSLKYLPKQMRAADEPEDLDIAEEVTAEEAAGEPASKAVSSPAPAEEAIVETPVQTRPADPIEDIDPEAILAEILREIDKNVE